MTSRHKYAHAYNGGYALVAVLTSLLVVTTITTIALHYLIGLHLRHLSRTRRAAALHLAEGGLAKAQWELSQPGRPYSGETGMSLGQGVVDVHVRPSTKPGVFLVVSAARVVRGSGKPTVCAIRAKLQRDSKGVVRLRSWSRVTPAIPALSAARQGGGGRR